MKGKKRDRSVGCGLDRICERKRRKKKTKKKKKEERRLKKHKRGVVW